jgi:hypothetical protein
MDPTDRIQSSHVQVPSEQVAHGLQCSVSVLMLQSRLCHDGEGDQCLDGLDAKCVINPERGQVSQTVM